MSVGSPCPDSSSVGTTDNGALSETAESVRVKPGRRVKCAFGGEEDGIIVDELGIGVG